jgi:hypothetical protein
MEGSFGCLFFWITIENDEPRANIEFSAARIDRPVIG